jgi:serine/threonine protein kinase
MEYEEMEPVCIPDNSSSKNSNICKTPVNKKLKYSDKVRKCLITKPQKRPRAASLVLLTPTKKISRLCKIVSTPLRKISRRSIFKSKKRKLIFTDFFDPDENKTAALDSKLRVSKKIKQTNQIALVHDACKRKAREMHTPSEPSITRLQAKKLKLQELTSNRRLTRAKVAILKKEYGTLFDDLVGGNRNHVSCSYTTSVNQHDQYEILYCRRFSHNYLVP